MPTLQIPWQRIGTKFIDRAKSHETITVGRLEIRKSKIVFDKFDHNSIFIKKIVFIFNCSVFSECPEASQFDEIYVVCMRSVCELAKPKAVFNFEHPNFERKSNARSVSVQFTIDMQSEVNI